jgi:glycosyltransferase involved in cell wall biosynthesis
MRILVLNYDHMRNPWVGGGGAYRLHRVFSYLSQWHEVTLVCGGWHGSSRCYVLDGVQYRLTVPAAGRLLSRLVYCAEAAIWAARGDYDLLVEGVSAFSATFAPVVSRRPTLADLGLNPFDAAGKYPRMAPLLRARLRHDLRYYDGTVALCASLARQLRAECPDIPDPAVVQPGVDRSFFDCNPVEEDYVLYLGRIDIDHKGLDHLLAAYARIQGAHPDMELVIAGAGPDEEKLRDLIGQNGLRERVKLAGWVEGREKVEILRKARLVCMPSRREGWGQVATEAAACGKPVLGYDVTGLKDSVADGETGLLVPSENVNALAAGMSRLLSDASLRHKLGRQARERARAFTWERTARAYEAVCEAVAARC